MNEVCKATQSISQESKSSKTELFTSHASNKRRTAKRIASKQATNQSIWQTSKQAKPSISQTIRIHEAAEHRVPATAGAATCVIDACDMLALLACVFLLLLLATCFACCSRRCCPRIAWTLMKHKARSTNAGALEISYVFLCIPFWWRAQVRVRSGFLWLLAICLLCLLACSCCCCLRYACLGIPRRGCTFREMAATFADRNGGRPTNADALERSANFSPGRFFRYGSPGLQGSDAGKSSKALAPGPPLPHSPATS